jgi:transcriptional activator SPT8
MFVIHVFRGLSPDPPSHTRSLSPAQLRKKALLQPGSQAPRSYTVEAICALPHPVPTHALASSLCMTHLLTGSDDGYIRDYDIFAAVNGKNFLTAPQRHHCGVVEGIMKAGQIRFWWENPTVKPLGDAPREEDPRLSPVYSLLMHSDALWALAGTDVCMFCFCVYQSHSVYISSRPVTSIYLPCVMNLVGSVMS